jgi:hypothetical protein
MRRRPVFRVAQRCLQRLNRFLHWYRGLSSLAAICGRSWRGLCEYFRPLAAGEQPDTCHALAGDADGESGGRILDQQIVEIERPVEIVVGGRGKAAGGRGGHQRHGRRLPRLDREEGFYVPCPEALVGHQARRKFCRRQGQPDDPGGRCWPNLLCRGGRESAPLTLSVRRTKIEQITG